jgi:cytochrome c-type biogenesis protein
MREVSFFLAFGYGVLSFVSPCVLPLIPVYLANMAGTAAVDAKRRWQTFVNSAAFVAGFTIMFALWGAGAGMLGSTLIGHMSTIRRVIGGLLVAFGALMLASMKIPWLNYEKRLTVETGRKAGLLRSFIIGAIFPVAWTPCASWVLGSIILLAGASESAARGALLLAVYSIGLGLPFLAAGIALDYLSPILRRVRRYATAFYIVSGVLLIGVGLLLLADKVGWFLGLL